MLFVVPVKKSLRKGTAVLNAPETVRELRPILQGAKLVTVSRPDASVGNRHAPSPPNDDNTLEDV
jgi:hypothetical protein